MSKLKAYGFCDNILTWVKSFLSNRRQRVVMGENYSEWSSVTSGVPQGGVLSPLIFVIFINDMPNVVHHIIKLFADDSKLIGILKDDNDAHLLQKDLDSLVKWADDWKMMFHPDKCKTMEITISNKINSNPHVFHMYDAFSKSKQIHRWNGI